MTRARKEMTEVEERARGQAESWGYKCQMGGEKAEELCRDGVCRKCHVSISFEDCMNDTWQRNHPSFRGNP